MEDETFDQPFDPERPRVFLLSPASTSGKRAAMVLREGAMFPLAKALRSPGGAPIGDLFAFMSGLYFRGKLTYARSFPGAAYVITACLGLMPIDEPITATTLRMFAEVDIDHENDRFRGPLLRDAQRLEIETDGRAEIVLLGSIASKKYVEILGEVFGDRLLFPSEFVGRGDMSRGGLLLRAASARTELDYAPVLGTVRKGKRPERLKPIRRDKAG